MPQGPTPFGWRFQGEITEARQALVADILRADSRLSTFYTVLQSSGPTSAYRLLHVIIRDAWEAVGITVSPDDGSRVQAPQSLSVPVTGWFDEELGAALKVWRSLRRRKKKHPQLSSACQRARRAFEKLQASKFHSWEQRWARFWIDTARCNHITVWKVVRALSGKKNLECTCSEKMQRESYQEIGSIRPNPDFDSQRAVDAANWIKDFIDSGRGLSGNSVPFSERAVRAAFQRLNQCGSGIDGLSKKFLVPILETLLPLATALFSYIYCHGEAVEDWILAVIFSLKKKTILLLWTTCVGFHYYPSSANGMRGSLFLGLRRSPGVFYLTSNKDFALMVASMLPFLACTVFSRRRVFERNVNSSHL